MKQTTEQFGNLIKKIELLCARCDRLHREKLQLQTENEKLRERNLAAKQRLEVLLDDINNKMQP